MRKILFFVLLIPFSNYAQVNLNLGLKAHYPFSNNANDISGSGFHGGVQGAQLTTDRFGNPNSAYYFDGVDDRIVVTDNGGLSEPAFSLVYYFMTEDPSRYQNCIGKVNYVDGNGATYNSGIISGSSRPYFGTMGSIGDCFQWVTSTLVFTTFSPTAIQANRWYCVVNTFQNGIEKQYIDGVLVSQMNTSFQNATYCSNTNFVMGSWWSGDPYRFKGKLDDVRYYNRALNAAEVNALCGIIPPQPISCSNWLATPSAPSYAQVGDLDVSGTQMTVEAVFNRTTPFTGGDLYAGNLVSKHNHPSTVNYLLRPNSAEITTSNGYFIAQAPCGIELNKTYHVAMTYDGASLKFFRNGVLLAQTNVTGNLYQNNLNTRIGWLDFNAPNENFIGFINEVKIWNIVRTPAEIQAGMQTTIGNPTGEPGLLAYYSFDNLMNKQGNTAYTATLGGAASINQVNNNCSFATGAGGASAFAGNDASYCSNTPVTHQLNGTPVTGATYTWQPAAMLNNASIANPVATVNSTTRFYFTVSLPGGCSGIDSVDIIVNPVPVITSLGDTSVCVNGNLQLNASGATSYSWTPATAVSNPAIANPVFTGTSNQTLTVTGTGTGGCLASNSFNVTVKPVPQVQSIRDTTICSTQAITLTTTGAQTYSWTPSQGLSDPNIGNPVFSGSSGNVFIVTGTAANGCSAKDTVQVTVQQPGVFNTPPDASVCQNGSVTLNGNNGNNVSYQWSPAATLSNPAIINPVATPSTVGNHIYSVTIAESLCNSSNTYNITVVVHGLPDINASRANDLDCTVRTTGLLATGGTQYSWTPASTLSNPNISNPIASPSADIKYIVTGTDANGCKNQDSVMVLVKGTNGRFDIPNSFTPNGDGLNDCFGVRQWGDASEFRMMIFNRYGEKVFETTSINNCWDGKYKGQPADIGAYVYYIKLRNLCGETVKKGNLLLIH
jgi:gliding motility-associated-like protein